MWKEQNGSATNRTCTYLQICRLVCAVIIGVAVMYYGAVLYGGIAAAARKLYFVAPIILGMAIGFSMSIPVRREESKINRCMACMAGILSLMGVILGNFFTALYMVLAEEKSDPVNICTITSRLFSMALDFKFWPVIFKLMFNDFGLYEIVCSIMGFGCGWGAFAQKTIPSFENSSSEEGL